MLRSGKIRVSVECEVANISPSYISLPVHVKTDRWRKTIVEYGMEVFLQAAF